MRLPVLVALFAGYAWGCSCAVSLTPNPPCQYAWQSAAVFTGMVVGIDDPGLPMYRPGEPPRVHRRKVRFRIAEALTGFDAKQQEVVVETGLGGGDCGYTFDRGRDYIVYAYREPDGALTTGICSRTRPIEGAGEDLAYFHSLPQSPPTAEIRVRAFDVHRMAQGLSGLGGVRVTLNGLNVRQEAVTDSAGRHVFTGLPPGEYRVEASMEGYVGAGQTRPVQAPEKGCAEVPLPMRIDRTVTGRVFHKDGRPASGVTVEAVAKGQSSAADSAATDESGRYELRNLGAGDYDVGVSLTSPPTLRSPYDPTRAGLVQITNTPGTLRFDLTLPEPQHERVIRGVVVWPDGRPVEWARVTLEDPRWPTPVPGADAASGKDGRFTLRCLDGTRYLVRAMTYGRSPMYTEAASIAPGSEPVEVRLALTRAGRPAPAPAPPR